MAHRNSASKRTAEASSEVDPLDLVAEAAGLLGMLATLHANGLALGGFAVSRINRTRLQTLPALAIRATGEALELDADSMHYLLFSCELEVPDRGPSDRVGRAVRAAFAEARHLDNPHSARWALLGALHSHLGRAVRQNRRQINRADWPDLRLDAWAETQQDAELHMILTDGLRNRSEMAIDSRHRLGRMVEERRTLRSALDRVETLMRGSEARPSPPTPSLIETVIVVPPTDRPERQAPVRGDDDPTLPPQVVVPLHPELHLGSR